MYLSTFQVQGNFEANGSTSDTIITQTMTVDDLSSTYSAEESLAVLTQRGATGRRCHKTLKGGGEAVWPPNLEAALIAGLQVYSDRHRVHMRHRGRFIGRNHFLSDYVRFITGRRRSAKQVGSRLQQLKDTCREVEILYLITGSRSFSPRRDSRRNKKSSPKASLRRSVSSSPEMSDESMELTPEPQGHNSMHYLSSPEAQHEQPSIYSAVPVESASPVYTPPVQCSYTNDQPSTAQYYTQSSQFYSPEWTNGAQSIASAYQIAPQQWVSYYSQPEPQQQLVYYNDSQYY